MFANSCSGQSQKQSEVLSIFSFGNVLRASLIHGKKKKKKRSNLFTLVKKLDSNIFAFKLRLQLSLRR